MTAANETVFSKILDGAIPCHRVYEDDHVLAFLDVGPLSRGHTLVIPKERAARVDELSDAAAAALGRVLPRLCRAITAATGADAYNVLINTGSAAGQEVMHVHAHIIPREGAEGVGLTWKPGKLGAEEAAELVEAIKGAL